MSDAAEDWIPTRLGDLAEVIHGWPFKTEGFCEDAPDRPVVVSIGNFDYSGGFRFAESVVRCYQAEYPSDYELSAGDVLLVMTCQTEGGEILGVPGRVPADGRTYLHNQRLGKLQIFRPDLLDLDFAYHLARTAEFNRQLFITSSGSKILHTSPTRIQSVVFPRPSVAEQKAIAEVLGALDAKIAANTKLASTSADLAGLIYDTAVSSRETQPMSHVLTPILGGTPPRANPAYWEEEYLWASARDVTSAPFGMIVDTAEKISNAAATTTKAKPLPLGSVILTARGTVGAVARLAVPSSFNQSCYGFVPDALPPGILYFSILRATQRAKAIAHGSVFDTITMKTFDHLDIPVLCETSVETLESRIGPLLDVISEAVKENATLANTRDALLPQLMSGRLRVKDVADVVGSLV